MKRSVRVELINNVKVVLLNNIPIKKFCIISDDYAYTNSVKYAETVRAMSTEDLIKYYPEALI